MRRLLPLGRPHLLCGHRHSQPGWVAPWQTPSADSREVSEGPPCCTTPPRHHSSPSPTRPDPDGFGWLPKNLNKGRLDLFLLCLGGIMTLNCIIFWRVAAKYEYKTVEHAQRVTVRVWVCSSLSFSGRRSRA